MLKVMKQFSVYLPNKPGELKRLLHKVKKLDLIAAATFANKDGAIMRLVPEDRGSFERVLKQEKVQYSKEDVVYMTVPDKPGGLLTILSKLQQAHVNIEGVYILGGNNGEQARCVLNVDDVKAAKERLS